MTMLKHDEVIGYAGSSFGAVMTALQTNELFQLVQLILSCVALVITIAYTVWKWWKKASQDKKIEDKELDELFDEIEDQLKKGGK